MQYAIDKNLIHPSLFISPNSRTKSSDNNLRTVIQKLDYIPETRSSPRVHLSYFPSVVKRRHSSAVPLSVRLCLSLWTAICRLVLHPTLLLHCSNKRKNIYFAVWKLSIHDRVGNNNYLVNFYVSCVLFCSDVFPPRRYCIDSLSTTGIFFQFVCVRIRSVCV